LNRQDTKAAKFNQNWISEFFLSLASLRLAVQLSLFELETYSNRRYFEPCPSFTGSVVFSRERRFRETSIAQFTPGLLIICKDCGKEAVGFIR
jgi:hypothetical protein